MADKHLLMCPRAIGQYPPAWSTAVIRARAIPILRALW